MAGMKANEVLAELERLGSQSYKKTLTTNHGVREPCFGVKIGDLKKIQKRIGMNRPLALELFDSGNYDAMYLAGLITDPATMTRRELASWARKADGGALPNATVAWVAAENPNGWDLAIEWIDSPTEHIAEAGWSTLSSIVAVKEDSDLNLQGLKKLLSRVEKTIHKAPDRIRYAMNGFVIAVGSYVKPLNELAKETAERIGPVTANLGHNSCQIPFAPDYIRKVEARGAVGKKRKSAKC